MAEESVGDAGSSALGYFGGCFSPDGVAIVAHGFTGALHLWRRDAGGAWAPRHTAGGHFAPVVDACWAVDGACLLSVAKDQTARVHAMHGAGRWCEIARPQVHTLVVSGVNQVVWSGGATVVVGRLATAPFALVHG
jgi:elongator complex protein 2